MPQRKNRKGKPISAPEKPQKKKDDQVVKVKKQRLFAFKAANGEWYRLTPKQKLFCDKYVELLGNGTQAAMFAYNVPYDSAKSIAYENLRKLHLIEYLAIQFSKVSITPDELMAQLAFLAKQNQNFSTKTKAIDMGLKVFGKYPVQKYEVEHGINEKLEKFLNKQNEKLP